MFELSLLFDSTLVKCWKNIFFIIFKLTVFGGDLLTLFHKVFVMLVVENNLDGKRMQTDRLDGH